MSLFSFNHALHQPNVLLAIMLFLQKLIKCSDNTSLGSSIKKRIYRPQIDVCTKLIKVGVILRSVLLILLLDVFDTRQDFIFGSTVALQLVCNDHTGNVSQSF